MKLTACMMVKDEEYFLPRCLKSIRPIMDQIVVVDTGSTDRTVEIAEEFGCEVYHHPWENDFSLHRNQSLSYAKGDWILIIDADEELQDIQTPVKKFRASFKHIDPNVNCLFMTVKNVTEDGQITGMVLHPRWFRRDAKPYYRNYIHNEPVITGWGAGTDMVLLHYGYNVGDQQKRFKRSTTLLFKRIEEDPRDKRAWYFLSAHFAAVEMFEEAVESGLRCLELVQDDLDEGKTFRPEEMIFFGNLYHAVGMSAYFLKDFQLAIAAVGRGLQLFPGNVNLHYDMAHIGKTFENAELVKEHGNRYLELVRKYRKVPVSQEGNNVLTADPSYEARIVEWLKEAA